MKKFQCYNDFEIAIKQENIPNIDEEVMLNKIYSKLEFKPKCNKLKIASIIICFILLTTGSITLAKNLYVYLFNDKGEKVFSIGKLSDEENKKNEDINKINSNYCDILDNIKQNTKPGEASVVVIAKEYEKYGAWHQFQNNKYKTLEEIKTCNLNTFKLPIFPDGVYVNDISVNLGVEIDEKYVRGNDYVDKLYKDCIAENKEYIVDTLKLNNYIQDINLYINYENNFSRKEVYGHRIQMNITRSTMRMSSDFDEKNVEKIKIGNKEAILEKWTIPDITTYNIIYVDNYDNENSTYTLYGFSEFEKPLVIEILKSLQ